MTRSSWFSLAYALSLGVAGPLAACASGDGQQSSQSALAESRLGQTQTGQATPPAETGLPYSDTQLRAFISARDEIQQLAPAQNTEQQAANQRRIGEILQQNNLAPDVYNAIATAARDNQAVANRIAALSVGSNISDAQLQAFVAASAEIDPLNRSLATATEQQRTQIAEQIRSALERHNIDLETYNGIAARAQTDEALATRIAQLRATQPPASEGE